MGNGKENNGVPGFITVILGIFLLLWSLHGLGDLGIERGIGFVLPGGFGGFIALAVGIFFSRKAYVDDSWSELARTLGLLFVILMVLILGGGLGLSFMKVSSF